MSRPPSVNIVGRNSERNTYVPSSHRRRSECSCYWMHRAACLSIRPQSSDRRRTSRSPTEKRRTLQAIPAPDLKRDHRIRLMPQHIIHQLLRLDHPDSQHTMNVLLTEASHGRRASGTDVLVRRQLLDPYRRTALATATRDDILVLDVLRRDNAYDRAIAHHLAEADEVRVWCSSAACSRNQSFS